MDEEKKAKLRQARLPEMEDPAIEAIERAADKYVEFRDERMAAMREEVDLKTKLIAVMKKNRKTTYDRGGYHIEIVVEHEKVKVKIKDPEKEAKE